MDLRLTGKRALIVGGSRGIGRATALQLAREGVAVAIAARSGDVEEVAARLAEESGGRIVGVRLDTKDDGSVRAGVAAGVIGIGVVLILVW